MHVITASDEPQLFWLQEKTRRPPIWTLCQDKNGAGCEISQPAPFLSWHRVQIGGLLVFSCNQNNCGSSDAVITCIYCSLSAKICKHKMQHGVQKLWMHLFCVCFRTCGQQEPEDPQLEPQGWQLNYIRHYMRFRISSLVYICGGTSRKLNPLQFYNLTT